MRSGRPEGDAPGRSDRPNKDGSKRVYWVASKEARGAGYVPETVRIHETDGDIIANRCRALQAEMLQWLAERSGARALKGPPSINDLAKAYRTREESAYHTVKWNTRRTYDKVLDMMERGFGETKLYAIKLADIQRWYRATRYPDGRGPGKPDHARTAHGLVAMLRRIARFGAAIEVRDCARIAMILESTKWEGAPKRSVALEFGHVEAVRAMAHGMGRPSLALCTALQWELMLRQRDVIGEWEPFDAAATPPPGPKINGRVWRNGLTWTDIDDRWILTKRTTKTGAIVRVDLTMLPMAIEELKRVPVEKRIGPVIADEAAGRPYAENRYQQEWRKVANAAGVPKDLWNMDARSGAATEADDAGASRSDLQRGMGHSDPKTTTRYVRGDALPSARRVATLRVAHRSKSDPERR